MLKTKIILLLLIVFCSSVYGADIKPSESSVKELMRVTESNKMLDNMMGQVDAVMKKSMQEALKGENITPKQQKQLNDMINDMIISFKQEMSWEKLEPLYIKIYLESFTQQEVDGMLAFYKSPSGKAVIRKMPLVFQNTMTEMQKHMGPFLQKMVQKEKDAIEKMTSGANQE